MRRLFGVCVLILILMLAGCGGEKNVVSAEETRVVKDHLGYQITLPKRIERVAVCDVFPLPSVISVFFDSAQKLVAVAPASKTAAEHSLLGELYPEILQVATGPVSGSSVNTEELLKLRPQVVFYSASNPRLGEKLRRSGFGAVAVSVDRWSYDTVATLSGWLELLTEIFPEDANQRARLVREYSEQVLKMIGERVAQVKDRDRVRTFFLFQYSDKSVVTSGRNFFGQYWANAVGAVNVAEKLQGQNTVKATMEQVYAWNPECIFITNFTSVMPEDLRTGSSGHNWQGIKAVQQGRVYKMPLGMYRSYTPGIDTPVTLLYLAKTVYPKLFQDVDVIEKTQQYYQRIFGINLSRAQAKRIFAPDKKAGGISPVD